MSTDKEPVKGCRVCGARPKVYAVVRYNDLAFWCSSEHWIQEEMDRKAKEADNSRFILTGVRYIDPSGK
jgi:hypothetical protein